MTETKRTNRGRGHSYTLDGRKAAGVTTLIGDGLPKPALISWGPRVIAEYVADRLVEDSDGRILADRLVDDLRDHARAKGKSWSSKRLSPSKIVEHLKGMHYEDRDAAGNRGTEVHGLVERLAAGEEVEVPEELVGHVDAYLAFRDDWQPTDEQVELVVLNRQWGYMGTLDLICHIDGLGTCLVDVKTNRSGPFGEVALQLAAYRYAEAFLDPDTGEEQPMPEIDRTLVLWLRADGYELYPFTAGPEQFRSFLYVAQVADFADGARDLKGEPLSPSDVKGAGS